MGALSQKIHAVVKALDQGRLVNDQMQTVSRWTKRWLVSLLVLPVCRLFGYDPFSHVKVNRVAEKLFQECTAHLDELTPDLLAIIKRDIFDRLNRKTHQRYEKNLSKYLAELQSLHFCPLKPPPADQPLCTWPTDLRVKVSADDQASIARFLTEEQQKVSFVKKNITMIMTGGHWRLPLTLRFFPGRVIAFLNKSQGFLIGKGGQRLVKSCVDLTNGRVAVKKQVSPYEAQFITALWGKFYEGYKGIPRIIGLYGLDPGSLKKVKKNALVEELYDGTLADLLGTAALDPLSIKIEVIDQLLSFMDALINIDPSLDRYDMAGWRSFHQDIKPLNILFKRHGSKLEVVMNDFGGVNWFDQLVVSVFYASPETMAFGQTREAAFACRVKTFNQQWGQVRDVWSLGMVFAQVLLNSKTPLETVHALYKIIQVEEKSPDLTNWFVVPHDPTYQRGELLTRIPSPPKIVRKLDCKPIDPVVLTQELQKIKASLQGPDQFILGKLWDLVSQMLHYDHQRRITIPQILLQWQEILKMRAIC